MDWGQISRDLISSERNDDMHNKKNFLLRKVKKEKNVESFYFEKKLGGEFFFLAGSWVRKNMTEWRSFNLDAENV